jgi:hypothetical protein
MRRRTGRVAGGTWFAMLLVGVLSLMSFDAAAAQDSDGVGVSQDGSTARAARLTFVQGAVTVDTPDSPGSQPAQTNLPLLTGVHLSTGQDGQAEVEFEDGSVVRLTPNSTLTLDTLSVDSAGVFTTATSLLRGLAYVELRASTQYHYTLTAGADVLSPVENATVRVNFDEPPAKFAVVDGAVKISRRDGGGERQVKAGETLQASEPPAGAGTGEYNVSQGVADDSWDAWNSDRDSAESVQSGGETGVRDGYAGSQGYGWADLDANGTWYDVPGQGQVWQPQTAVEDASFDPYGTGAWMWYPAAGYVWASGYPWGWTPYRCGNWNYFGGFGWGWSPAGCGGTGWRFWGTGRQVNVGYGPSGYRVPVVPRPRPGPVHPILPTRLDPARETVALGGQTGWGTLIQRGPRQIGGQIAMPVERRGTAGAGVRQGGAMPPNALVRDYPVDRSSHVAVTGRVSILPGMVHTESGWQRGAGRAQDPALMQGRGAPAYTVQGGASQGYTGQSGAAVFRQRQQQQGNETPLGGVATPAVVPGVGTAGGPRRVEGQPGGARSQYVAPVQGQPAGLGGPRWTERPAYVPPAGQAQRPYNAEPGQRSGGYAPRVGGERPGYAPPVQQQMQRAPSQVQTPRYTPPPEAPHYSPPPAPVQHAAPASAGAPAGAGRSPK